MFKGIVVDKDGDAQTVAVAELDEAQLPEGDVTVDVEYSTMNYKDGLAITGAAPVIRAWPMVPGIDFSGVVSESGSEHFKPGDRVLLNGYGLGEGHWGGLAQKARVRSEWLVPIPQALSTRQAMIIGTAGYTAALCVDAIVNQGVTPDDGEVLVTGASGGVGSVAISLLAKAGFDVAASTGKLAEADYLKGLGAKSIIDRSEFSEPGKPLQGERWAAVVDSVGSHTLANACAQTRYGGAVAACGLAQGADLPLTVMPFILRGVNLLGIDSVMAPMPPRLAAWERLARDLDGEHMEAMVREVGLAGAEQVAAELMQGQVRGRVLVDVNA